MHAAAAAPKQDLSAEKGSPLPPAREEAGRIIPQGTGHAGKEAATYATITPGGKAAGHAEAASSAGRRADPATGGGRTGAEEAAGAEGAAGGGPTSGGGGESEKEDFFCFIVNNCKTI